MADIARIGFAADTSGLQRAVPALTSLIPASQAVERAVDGVAGAFDNASAAAGGVGPPLDAVKNKATAVAAAAGTIAVGTTNATRAIIASNSAHGANAIAMNNAGKAAQGLSNDAKNLSYQLVDVTQGVLSGQPIFQIFAQQAGQIGQVLATTKGSAGSLFKEIYTAITSVLTPTRLLALGIIALAGAFIYLGTSTISGLKALDDMARSVDLSITKYRQLQQAASFKGISADDFATGIKQFGDSVYNAQRNMGGLNGLMIASGMKAKDLQGYLGNVADLVARTASDQQKYKILQEAGLPINAEWVRFMSQGSAGIRAAIAETVNFNSAAETNLIAKARAFDDAWNKATTKFSQYFKSAMVDSLNAIDQLTPKMSAAMAGVAAAIAVALAPFSLLLAGIAAVVAAGLAAKAALGLGGETDKPPTRVIITGGTTQPKPGPDPKTQAELLAANQQAQQRISILGELATVEDQVKLKQLEINSAVLQGVGPRAGMTDKIINATRAQAENTRVQAQAQVGVFDLATAQKAAADTLQMWIDKGLVNKNNAEQMAAAQTVLNRSIRDTSDAAAVAAAPLQSLKRLQLDASDFMKVLDNGLTSSLNGIVSPLQDAMNGVTSFGTAFKNVGVIVLKAIQEMVIKMLIIAPIAKALMSIFTPFAGLFSVFGGAAGAATSGVASAAGAAASIVNNAKGNAFNDNGRISAFAKGSAFTNSIVSDPTLFKFANGGGFNLGVMGERGHEAVMPLQRGPDGSLGVQMYGGNDNSASVAPAINYAPQYNVASGVGPDQIADLYRLRAEDRKNAPKIIADTLIEMRRRNVRV